MNDDRIKNDILKSFKQECDYISQIDAPEYQTSAKFQAGISKILNKGAKRLTRKFAAACSAVFFALGAIASFTVYAASPQLRSFIISIFGENKKISVSDDDSSPEYISTYYLPTAIPEGYRKETIIGRPVVPSTANTIAVIYRNGENHIYFGQYIKSIYNDVDWQADKIEYFTDETGQEYLIATMADDYVVLWDNGEYVLHIYCTLSKEETIEICKSVEPVSTVTD